MATLAPLAKLEWVKARLGEKADKSSLPKVITRDGAASTFTKGNVVLLGEYAFNERADAGTGIVAGGAAAGTENVIGGVLANVDTGESNLGGPDMTGSNGNWNFLLGGYDNVVRGWAVAMIGYHCTVADDANHVAISGGSRHQVEASASYISIGGGTGHVLGGAAATVAGGGTNTARGNNSAIGGGNNNSIAATASAGTIAGGSTNSVAAPNASVGGGNSNKARGNSATVSGGLSNDASGTFTYIGGGRENQAIGNYSSTLGGRGAVATNVGERAQATGFFAAAGDAQVSQIVMRQATTDATVKALKLDGYDLTITENTTWAFTATVVARQVGASASAAWEVKGVLKRDVGSTAALVGTPTVTSLGATASIPWTLAVQSYSAGNLMFNCGGEAGKSIRWVGNLDIVQAQG